MGLLSFFFGSCSEPTVVKPHSKQPPEITSDIEDEGFVDLTFAILSHQTRADGSQELRVQGVHAGQDVGLIVVLGPKWKKGTLDPDVPIVTYQGRVEFRSFGPASNTLIRILDELYATNIDPKSFRSETTFTAISLEGEPADLAKGPTKIKLFFESEDEDRYAELFTNVDLANDILQIREKDPEYRAGVIRALRAE